MKMTSTRPYLIRAFYDWIVDNNLTPYMVIRTDIPAVKVPQEYIEEDKIILNVSPYATDGLDIGNRRIQFQASFSGVITEISAPIGAVMAIYANENGRGMVFGEEEFDDGDDDGSPPDEEPPKPTGKPRLTVVK